MDLQNLDYSTFAFAGVIWVLDICMVLMSVLVRLPVVWVGGLDS